MITIASSCSAPKPSNIGKKVTDTTGRSQTTLAPCPDKPNCITSYIHNKDRDHYLPALRTKEFTSKVRAKLLEHLKQESRVKIIKSTESYIHAEYTSLVFRFVDDLELYFAQEGVIHFRSAARTGYSDLGVNKRRVQALGKLIKKKF